jgi:hypothetical protein
MSRSKRKTKIFGYCGFSEKKDKRMANRIFRRKTRCFLKIDVENTLPIDLNEVYNVYNMEKDGKHYWADAPDKAMRK